MATAAALHERGVQQVVASPFQRCLQTAAVIASALGVSDAAVEIDWTLCEARCLLLQAVLPRAWAPRHALALEQRAGVERALPQRLGQTSAARECCRLDVGRRWCRRGLARCDQRAALRRQPERRRSGSLTRSSAGTSSACRRAISRL